MFRTAILVLIVSAVSLAGCFSDRDATTPTSEPRTHRIDLIINADRLDLPLYTLNDGETTMNVIAMGFQLSGDEGPLEVPNPQLRFKEGDTVIITVRNLNPLPHTFHLHGNLDDWTDDGVPFVSQMPIHNFDDPTTPAEENVYTYSFENIKAGTYWYHCHVDAAHHIDLGMYGAFIVEEREPQYGYDFDLEEHVLMFDEWDNCHVHGGFGPIDPRNDREESAKIDALPECARTVIQDQIAQNQAGQNTVQTIPEEQRQAICNVYNDPATPEAVKEQLEPVVRQLNCEGGHGTPPPNQSIRQWYYAQHPVYVPNYNTYLINGKAFPDTKPILFEEGKTYRMRLINVGEEMHSIHIHGHNMQVIARDGYQDLPPYRVDTLSINPGERFDVLVKADNPGFWVFHDHVGLNTRNDAQDPGGMFTVIGYQGFMGQTWDPQGRSIDLVEFTYEHHSSQHDAHTPILRSPVQAGMVR